MAAGILAPCSSLSGAWASDAGATSFGPHSFTIHNWRQPSDPVEVQNWSTGTLRRGQWDGHFVVTAPSSVTTHATASSYANDPPVPLPNARIFTRYPDVDFTGQQWVDAVYTPGFPWFYSNGTGEATIYDGGPIYTNADGTIYSRDWTLSTYGMATDVNQSYFCVADLEQTTGCCWFPSQCIYPLDDLIGLGIDRSTPRSFTWTVRNDLLGGSPGDPPIDWAATGLPETSTVQVSGYWLGDPPP
jgi:hypothetical protein